MLVGVGLPSHVNFKKGSGKMGEFEDIFQAINQPIQATIKAKEQPAKVPLKELKQQEPKK